jgi:arabinogalactan oligomer/maltooligosaccharide transport system permease protein
MVKPMIMFLALSSFTSPWMDFIFPRLILRSDDKKTLAVGLFELINGRANDNFTMFAAGALLVAVPFAILFMSGQKFLLKSMAGDGTKE